MSDVWAGRLGMVLCLCLAAFIFSFGLPVSHAQVLFRDGKSALRTVQADPGLPLSKSLRTLDDATLDMRLATSLFPPHADAWAGIAAVEVERQKLLSGVTNSSRKTAMQAVSRAMDLRPAYWRYHILLGDVRQMASEAPPSVEAAYQQAVKLAPDAPEAWAALADYLVQLDGRQSSAREAAQRALALDPEQQLAQSVLERLALRGY